MAYFKRLQQTASDPVAFEKMALGEQNGDSSSTKTSSNEVAGGAKTTALSSSSKTNNGKDGATAGNDVENDQVKRQRGYQRAEDWEAEQAQEKKKMSWEERVQYDGQQHGNKFQQNEILRKNLHR
jgi:hypothetical protein